MIGNGRGEAGPDLRGELSGPGPGGLGHGTSEGPGGPDRPGAAERACAGRRPAWPRKPVRTTILVAALILARGAPVAAQETDGFYVSAATGLTSAFGADVTAFGANHPTRCDRLLYSDPASAPTDAACAAPLASSRQGAYVFDRNSGTAQALALGYATGRLRFEGELLFREQKGAATPFDVGADASLVSKDTEWSALSPPNGDIYSFRSWQVFANAFHAFGGSSGWTPYLGAGAGLAWMDFGFYVEFLRKSVAEGYLEAFGGSRSDPEAAPEWQRAAAGTLSMMDSAVNETAFGYQLLAGLDRALGERAALGFKIRWTSLQTASADLQAKVIRSHEPVHADGRTPFVWEFEFAGMGYLGAALEMSYRF